MLKKINWMGVAQILVVSVLMVLPLFAQHASAQLSTTNNQQLCAGTGLNCVAGQGGVNGLIKTVINWLLAIAFGVAVLFLIIGGFWYITSAGNEETAEKGKGTVINALIGIVIIILSFVIINVVAGLVVGVGTNGSNGP